MEHPTIFLSRLGKFALIPIGLLLLLAAAWSVWSTKRGSHAPSKCNQNVSALKNAARDAEALAAEFDALGFRKITLLRDVTREQMFASLRAFAKEAEISDWAVIYFAGHGLEMGGINWLAPVDAQFKTDRDVRLEAVSIDELSATIEGVRGLRLIVLDACRNNPFAPREKRAARMLRMRRPQERPLRTMRSGQRWRHATRIKSLAASRDKPGAGCWSRPE